MNHTGETTRLIFVDSRNRDQALFPTGNNFTLHLTTPIKNVRRVDLVSARVPNTMYNITNGSSVYTETISNKSVSINPGFYSVYTIATAITNDGTLTLTYLPAEGHMIFSSPNPFTLQINSTEFAKLVGFPVGTQPTATHVTAPTADPTFLNQYVIRSSTLVDASLNDYVFLDIEELRTPWNLDAKSLSSKGTYVGSNSTRMFAPIIMDVGSACIKNFHENSDYEIHVDYPEPIGTLQRLTIHWYDKDGNSLNFNGWDNNAFMLRLHVTDNTERHLPPVQPLQDTEIRRIVEALTFVPPKEPEPPRKIPWVTIVLLILVSILIYKNFSGSQRTLATVDPLYRRS